MKKRFTLFVSMSIVLLMLWTNVFAASENANFALKQRDVEEDNSKLINQDASYPLVNNGEIENYYEAKAFIKELQDLEMASRITPILVEKMKYFKGMNGIPIQTVQGLTLEASFHILQMK